MGGKQGEQAGSAATAWLTLTTSTGAEAHVYTLEVSFYGYSDRATGPLTPFTQTDYIELGTEGSEGEGCVCVERRPLPQLSPAISINNRR